MPESHENASEGEAFLRRLTPETTSPTRRVSVQVLLDLLPSGEIWPHTERVLLEIFEQLPPQHVLLAEQAFLCAGDVRRPVAYMVGIGRRMLNQHLARRAA